MSSRSTAKGSLRLPFAAWTLLAVALTAAAGCADVSGQALQQDVAQLRQDLNSLTPRVHASRGHRDRVAASSIRRRASRRGERQAERGLNAGSTRSPRSGRVSARVDELSSGSRPWVAALRRRRRPGPAARSGAPAPSVAAVPPPARSGGASAEESYQAAYLDFSKGLYPLAVSGFRDFLRRFPDSPLADSSQYWIGEAYFSMARATASQPEKARENLEQAVQEFRKVVVAYPRGSKVPTALYKEALALVDLKQTALAQARLQYLVEHFPQSEEAPLAKERLASLKD